jgi:hypothetical protein
MSFLLCCGGRRPSISPTLVAPDGEQLRTLQPASFVSIVLPSDTVPHRPATGVDETKALRDIFGASPSSHRGYQAAAKSSGSFDANFKFGGESPSKPRTKAQRSVDKLGQNIRQRLSQSRLSHHSSKKSVKDVKSTETVVHIKLPPNSHRSTGLEELLVSRNVSQGGYDSDAKGIDTPSWTNASAGSILVSPEYTAKFLNACDGSPRKRSASLPRTVGRGRDDTHSPVSKNRNASTPPKDGISLKREERTKDADCGTRLRAASSPIKLTTPERQSFSAMLQLGPQESPSDVLRRLSVGLANGTIKLPDTPELKAMRMPSIVEAMPEWRLSFAAPKRASSLHRGDPEVRQALKALSDRMEKAKRDSAGTFLTESDNRASLLSSLDPALLHFISRYGEEQDDRIDQPLGDSEDRKKDEQECHDQFALETASHADTSGFPDLAAADTIHLQQQTDMLVEQQDLHLHPGLSSEKESVHLFDMRISQRLASTSVFPTRSPSSMDIGSRQQRLDRTSQSFGKLEPLARFIGQTSAEHLRKPSDPSTRRLFEPPVPTTTADGKKGHSKWKSVVSSSTFNPDRHTWAPGISRDDASSVYQSEGGFPESEVASIVSHRARANSRPNPYSLVIAGRQASLSQPTNARRNTVGQVGSLDRTNQPGIERRVSDGKHKQSKFSEDFGAQRKGTRGWMDASDGADTISNEKMSLADLRSSAGLGSDLNESMSEIDAVGLDEKLTALPRIPGGRHLASDTTASGVSQEGVDNEQSPYLKQTQSDTGPRNDNEEPLRTVPRTREECATNMWERALRTAREDRSFGSSDKSFVSSFHERRRDRSHNRRLSATGTSHEHDNAGLHVPALERRSRSLSPVNDGSIRRHRESFDLEKHQSLCVEARKPLTRPNSPAPSIHAKQKKRSLLDIRRLITAGTSTIKSTPITNTTPRRDIQAWARFPSHTRLDRNGTATDKDGVRTRDFSPPAHSRAEESQNPSKLSLMTQPSRLGSSTLGSWRILRFGHARRKSRSMDFASQAVMSTAAKGKVEKKTSANFLSFSLSRLGGWKRLYRSQSSDLRRLKKGHRSSVSNGGRVEYPELEVVAGFDGVVALGRKEKQDRENSRKRSFGRTAEREVAAAGQGRQGCCGGPGDKVSTFDGSIYSDELVREISTPRERPAPSRNGNGNAWADLYQDCVAEPHDTGDLRTEQKSTLSPRSLSPGPTPRASKTPIAVMEHGIEQTSISTSGRRVTGSGSAEESSYISCSVDLLSEDENHPHCRSTMFDLKMPGSFDGTADMVLEPRTTSEIGLGGRRCRDSRSPG